MAANKKHTFFGAAAVLMAGSIVVKIIGAIYKIPLGNILSDEAFVDFNTAYMVYSIFLTVATAGLPVALSKTIAEADALDRRNQVRRIFSVAVKAFLVMGAVSFLAMTLAGGWLARLMGNESAVMCVQALAPSALCVCVMAAFRGYYQGHSNMVPTAVSQIIESAFKLIFGLALAMLMVQLVPGAETYKQRMAAVGAILGVSIGSAVALVFIVLHFFRGRRERLAAPAEDRPDSGGAILSRLLKLAIPITLSASAVSIISAIDNRVVLNLLRGIYVRMPELITPEAAAQVGQEGGVAAELFMAQGLKGIFDKCSSLYNLPSALMVPFTASVIPAVSAALSRKDKLGASRVTESALRISALVALPMGVGLCALGGPIVSLLYPAMDVAVGGPVMSVLGVSSIFVSIMLLCNSILQANGYVNIPIATTVVGGVVKIGVNYLLVGDPAVNIHGATISTLACFAAVAVLDIIVILRVVPSRPNFFRAFAKPVVASAVMGAAAWAASGLTGRFLGARLGCVVGILAGGIVYLILVILLRVFSKEDLELMPKGDKIARILRIR